MPGERRDIRPRHLYPDDNVLSQVDEDQGDQGAFSPRRGAYSSAQSAATGEAAVQDPTDTSFSVEVSYLEIYNETLRDLFNPAPGAGRISSGRGGERGSTSNSGGVSVSVGGLRLREDPRYGHGCC